MEKKYQVFVSSTYEDLKSERQAAISCLLDMGCIPVGMEQFPASSLSQWEYIKKMIDMSDYYLLIVAGKYGSIDPEENISYTEKEYRYAVKSGIPVLSFLVKDIGDLPSSKVGKTDEERENVERFRNDIMNAGRLVKFYSSKQELESVIAKSIPKIINDNPRPGWVRADQAELAINEASDKSGINEIINQLNSVQEAILQKVEQSRVQWEPISTEEIEGMFEANNSKTVIPELSANEISLLLEAVEDPTGQVLVIKTLEGTSIETNGKTMNSELIGRDAIEWEGIVAKLISKSILQAVGKGDQIYQLTSLGYEISDALQKGN